MEFVSNVGRRSKIRGDTSSIVHIGSESLNGYENNALYRNLGGGRFFDCSYIEGCDRLEDGRGLAVADIDNDGDLDLILANYMLRARLLVNRGTPGNHWLKLKLEGTESNRSAIGARVVIQHGRRRQVREVSASAGYLSGQPLTLHFGLGHDAVVDRVEITWPSKPPGSPGMVELRDHLPADRHYRFVEGEHHLPPTRVSGGQ